MRPAESYTTANQRPRRTTKHKELKSSLNAKKSTQQNENRRTLILNLISRHRTKNSKKHIKRRSSTEHTARWLHIHSMCCTTPLPNPKALKPLNPNLNPPQTPSLSPKRTNHHHNHHPSPQIKTKRTNPQNRRKQNTVPHARAITHLASAQSITSHAEHHLLLPHPSRLRNFQGFVRAFLEKENGNFHFFFYRKRMRNEKGDGDPISRVAARLVGWYYMLYAG